MEINQGLEQFHKLCRFFLIFTLLSMYYYCLHRPMTNGQNVKY